MKEQIRRVATGLKVFGISKHALGNILVPLPELSEQRAIVEALSDVNGLLESQDTLIAKKRAIKEAIKQQLLTGKTRLPGFTGAWKTKRIGDMSDVNPEDLTNSTNPEFTFNYISLEQVDAGRLLGYSEERFRTAPIRARRVLRYGDVLVATVRQNLMAHLLYRDQIPNSVCSTGFSSLEPNPISLTQDFYSLICLAVLRTNRSKKFSLGQTIQELLSNLVYGGLFMRRLCCLR